MGISIPSASFAQDLECSYIGNSQRLVRCNGEKFFIFPEEKGKKMLADLKKIPKLKEEIALKQKRIDVLNEKLTLKNEYISFLEHENNQLRDTNHKLLDSGFPKEEKFWEKGLFQFGVGVVAASIVYIGWQATYDRVNFNRGR